jgi:hypothetical protein
VYRNRTTIQNQQRKAVQIEKKNSADWIGSPHTPTHALGGIQTLVGIRSPDGLVVGSCTSFGFDSQTRGTRPPWVKVLIPVPHGSQREQLCDRYCSNNTMFPSYRRLTQQLTKHWPQFKALRQYYASTCFEEQRQLHLPQKHKATVPESTLRVEMNALEEQADNVKARDLYWKPLSWLGTIRPSSANSVFDPTLWATFVSTTLGLEASVLSSLPCHHNNTLAQCGCKKHCMDFHGDHTSTCTAHSGATKTHDWMVGSLGPLFRTAGHTVRMQHSITASTGQERGNVEIRNTQLPTRHSRPPEPGLRPVHDPRPLWEQ